MTERSRATIQHGLASEDTSSIAVLGGCRGGKTALSHTCEGEMTKKATGHHTALDHKYFTGGGGGFPIFFPSSYSGFATRLLKKHFQTLHSGKEQCLLWKSSSIP